MCPREADTVGSQPLTLLRCSARSRGAVVVRPPLKSVATCEHCCAAQPSGRRDCWASSFQTRTTLMSSRALKSWSRVMRGTS